MNSRNLHQLHLLRSLQSPGEIRAVFFICSIALAAGKKIHANGWNARNEDAHLVASDAADHEYFGWSVTVDGDVIAVGAGSERISGGSALGAVFVYRQPAAGWVSSAETDKLVALGSEYDEDFAACLAIQDGVILAGAPKAVLKP